MQKSLGSLLASISDEPLVTSQLLVDSQELIPHGTCPLSPALLSLLSALSHSNDEDMFAYVCHITIDFHMQGLI